MVQDNTQKYEKKIQAELTQASGQDYESKMMKYRSRAKQNS